jgi:hypothetical protein
MRKEEWMKMVLIAMMIGLAACGINNTPHAVNAPSMEPALIIGSAESPDPVLTRVMALEKSGVVKDVVVQESFPVQIRLRAPKQVIDELNKIPRVGEMR